MDYAPNATLRYRLRYLAAGVQHYITVRYARGTDPDAILLAGNALMVALFTALQPIMPTDLQAIAVDIMPADGTFWTPYGTLPVLPAGAASAATYKPTQKITSVTFPGKGGASKARVVVFGCRVNFVDDTQAWDTIYYPVESAVIGDAIDVLNADTNLRAINNEECFWYQRATVKVNDRLLRNVRRGIIA